MVSLSLIIATCGRPDRLAKCLDAVQVAMRNWGGEGEVIVVDNHPEYEAEGVVRDQRPQTGDHRPETTDQRPEEEKALRATIPGSDVYGLRSKVSSVPQSNGHGLRTKVPSDRQSAVCSLRSAVCRPLRYLRSVPFNKAKALNAGIAAAQGEWLAFTDDDTLPDAGWLREGMACLQRAGWRVMGGRVTPGPDPVNLPRWLRPGRSGRVPGIGVHVRYEPFPDNGVLSKMMTAPFGANLFVRKDVFRQYGGYDENLWRLCEREWPVGCEDSEFGHRLKLRGEPIGYCRAALVVHPVNADRASLSLHLRRAFCEGWRQPLIFSEERRAWFEPFRARVLLRHAGGVVADGVRGDPAGAADHLVEAARMVGSIAGRWSAAYRSRRTEEYAAHAHRIVH